jgi:hypothetical protein
MTTIEDEQSYRAALERLNRMRADGARESDDAELADLEAAVRAYAQRADAPTQSKGKPTADPYGDEASERTPPGAGSGRQT